jgi:hypothetical protein
MNDNFLKALVNIINTMVDMRSHLSKPEIVGMFYKDTKDIVIYDEFMKESNLIVNHLMNIKLDIELNPHMNDMINNLLFSNQILMVKPDIIIHINDSLKRDNNKEKWLSFFRLILSNKRTPNKQKE